MTVRIPTVFLPHNTLTHSTLILRTTKKKEVKAKTWKCTALQIFKQAEMQPGTEVITMIYVCRISSF